MRFLVEKNLKFSKPWFKFTNQSALCNAHS